MSAQLAVKLWAKVGGFNRVSLYQCQYFEPEIDSNYWFFMQWPIANSPMVLLADALTALIWKTAKQSGAVPAY